MTDDRNDGAVPPPSQPSAPPPLAGAPPPMAPVRPVPQPQPVPQPMPAPYYPPSAPAGNGKWILAIILAFAAGVGATILTLWLTGDLWNERSSSYPSSYGSGTSSSSGSGTSSYGGSLDTNSASIAPQASGTAPTAYTLRGTWGPNCPSSRSDVLTFYEDGTAEGGDGQRGTWSLNGNYVNLATGGQTLSLYWEMLADGSARVRRSGDSRQRTIYRCL